MFPLTVSCPADRSRTHLQEPTGRDELVEWGRSSAAASRFVMRLAGTGDAASLSLSSRDVLAAELFQACFGDQVSARSTCLDCRSPLDLRFSLSEYRRNRLSNGGPPIADESGLFMMEAPGGSIRFRLPSIADELALASSSEVDAQTRLIELCVASEAHERLQSEPSLLAEVEATMARCGPLLSGPIGTRCIECHGEQEIEFDVATFLLDAFRSERGIVLREVHCLARAYGWGWNEIVDLPRSQRRALVELVALELDGVRRVSPALGALGEGVR